MPIWLVLITAVVAIAPIALWMALKRRGINALSPEDRAGLDLAQKHHREYRAIRKSYDKRTKAAEKVLRAEEDPKGRLLKSGGGIRVFERHIETPQGAGSIVGVHAHAADESSLKSRITATRMVTLGVFALAAPKRKGTGNAYVVVEGPDVTGVATISGENNKNAGPDAYALAATINNAARAAEVDAPKRPTIIAAARAALAQAQDRTDVDLAHRLLAEASQAVPLSHRQKFDRQLQA